MTIRRAGVVGGGAVGRGIALACALARRPVTVYNTSRDSSGAAQRQLRQALTDLMRCGHLSAAEAAEAGKYITMTTVLGEAVAGQDIVIEAVPEDLTTKQELFAELDRLAVPDVLLTSTTTALRPGDLAARCAHPERVLVTHFYLPAHLIPLVDVIPGERTAPAAVERAVRFLTELGKSALVLAAESVAIGVRLQSALIGEALRIVADGRADPVAVDRSLTEGIGRRLGVTGLFDRMDFAGLDTVAATLRAQGKPVPPVVVDKEQRGELGVKSGKGFYDWPAAAVADSERRLTEHLVAQLRRDSTAPVATGADVDGMRTVVVAPDVLPPFLERAVAEYRAATPEQPPRCFAVLLGTVGDEVIRVERAAFGRSVRDEDPRAVAEFAETIVPCFGAGYANPRRGFWCDSADLLRIAREADAAGLDILGSLHLHPDWHRIGPPTERGLRISEGPTPMDVYMFRQTAWPVNMICYLEERHGALCHTVAAWAPPPADSPDTGCRQLDLKEHITG